MSLVEESRNKTPGIIYETNDIENLIYSSVLGLRPEAEKINKKLSVRKNNNDLKLLISEVLFINRYVENDDSVILYIGAGPGTHISKLIKMYPNMKFHLYDSEQINVEESENVRIFNKKFTMEDCTNYDNSVYIITDFKDTKYDRDESFITTHEKNKWQADKELSYLGDMILQRDICVEIKPKAAFLRFRPSHYYSGINDPLDSFEYFSGVIWMMIYNDYKSTESRLAVTDFTITNFKWSIQTYQYKLNFFNYIVRESLALNPFTNDSTPLPNQLGNKFETVMMVKIILEYFRVIGIFKPRISEIMSFYSDFLVVESCRDIDLCDLGDMQLIDN